MGENLTSFTPKGFRDSPRAGIACSGVEQLLLCLEEPSSYTGPPTALVMVRMSRHASASAAGSVARCFSRSIPGGCTAGSFHDQDEQLQLGILAGCELCWSLQLLLLSVSHSRAGRGTLGIPCFSFSSVLLVSPGNVCTGCDGCRLAQGDNSGRKSKGRSGEAVCVVGSVGLSWALLSKTSPLLFPTVFTALSGNPCQALPDIPWHRALAASWRQFPQQSQGQAAASKGSAIASPSVSQLAQGCRAMALQESLCFFLAWQQKSPSVLAPALDSQVNLNVG